MSRATKTSNSIIPIYEQINLPFGRFSITNAPVILFFYVGYNYLGTPNQHLVIVKLKSQLRIVGHFKDVLTGH